jgi:hypothetical protein
MLKLRNLYTDVIERQIVAEGLNYIQKPSNLHICFNNHYCHTHGQEYGVNFIVLQDVLCQICGSRQKEQKSYILFIKG